MPRDEFTHAAANIRVCARSHTTAVELTIMAWASFADFCNLIQLQEN